MAKHDPRIKALRARLHGARYAYTIAQEALRAGIPYAVAFASVEQESGFRNVFGHDNFTFAGQPVTNAKVDFLIRHVEQGGASNGVGFPQLTYIAFIKAAHRLPGGAAKVRNQLRVSFELLADLKKQHRTWHEAFRAYNGTGPLADNYAKVMDVRVAKWRQHLRV